MPFELPNNLNEVVFPTLEDVIFIHDEIALLTGGRIGMLKIDNLQGAIGRPHQAALYNEEADFVLIAVYFWHGISTSHGFNDGNKRTALLTAISFLRANGFVFEAGENEPGNLVIEWMANGVFELPTLDNYLRPRCRPAD